ncbi:MAG: hypothetical protein BWY98_01182 [Tenericutes bacterium ADurb.BinA155]|jgi:hypothetical protein|nr:MAG: hypothetical protein BWY98_01182 [Tenericutes bacterium ADurb.BinA155]
MKVLGRIFLIIAGVCFLANGIWGLVDLVKMGTPSGDGNYWFAYILLWFEVVVQILGGAGAIFYAIGFGPFRGWVGPVAIVILVLWIAGVISASITFAKDPAPENIWPVFQSSIIIAPVEVLYVLGYLFVPKKRG